MPGDGKDVWEKGRVESSEGWDSTTQNFIDLGPPGCSAKAWERRAEPFAPLVFTFPHLQTNKGNCGKFQWPWSLVQKLKITTSLLPCKFPAGQTSWSGGSCQTRAKGIPSKFPGTPWPGWKWNFQGISLFSLRFWIGLGFFLFQWRWFCQASKQQDFRIVNFIVNLTTLLKLCLLNPGFMDTFQEIFQNHSLPLLPVCFQHFFPQDGPDFFL